MAYSLRKKEKNYKVLSDIRLPCLERSKQESDLYAVEIVERDESEGHVKVHFTGYGEEYDEWKLESEHPQPFQSKP